MKELSAQIKLKNGNLKTIYVEVEDELAEFLKSKTKEEIHNFIVFEYESKLTERKETRRHTSANMLYEKGIDFEDYNQDTESVLDSEKKYNRDLELEKLQKKVFAKYLTERQAEAFYQFVILKYNKTKIAKSIPSIYCSKRNTQLFR